MSVAAPNPLAEGLHDYRVADPSIMVIFGATGDLSGRKLLPALYNLAKQRLLPAGFAVVGAAIDDLDNAAGARSVSEVHAIAFWTCGDRSVQLRRHRSR